MGCSSHGSDKILVGRNLVGLTGLIETFRAAEQTGYTDREQLVDCFLTSLAQSNYISRSFLDDYRIALWREFLRYRGEDFSAFFSEIEVAVHGDPGLERDKFGQILSVVFHELELNPLVSFHPPVGNEKNPQLSIDGVAIVRGLLGHQAFKTAVRRSLSEW